MANKYLFLDSEIDGLPIKWKSKNARRPRIVRMTWAIFDEKGTLEEVHDKLIAREEPLLIQTKQITGLTNKLLMIQGSDREEVLYHLLSAMEKVDHIVSYNLNLEMGMLENELGRQPLRHASKHAKKHCLKKSSVVEEQYGQEHHRHYLSLSELYFSLFLESCNLTLTPYSEINAMARCFFHINKLNNKHHE